MTTTPTEDSTQEPIITKRLILRPINPSKDAADVLSFMKIPRTLLYTPRNAFTSIDQTKTYLAERASGPNIYNFAVTLKPTDSSDSTTNPPVIGLLGSFGYPKIGYLFNPAYSGKGYATEALLAFLPKLFAIMPYDLVEAQVDAENRSSEKLLERCGFEKGEITRDDYVSPQLGTRDSFCWRIAREGMSVEEVRRKIREEEDGQGFVPDLQ